MPIDRTAALVLVCALAALVACAYATGEHAAVAVGACTTVAAALTRSLLTPAPRSVAEEGGANSRTESLPPRD